MSTAQEYIEQAKSIQEEIIIKSGKPELVEDINYFIKHANRQIDQTIRRIINKEVIPHEEKVFSIFESYTEWICKGKAGVPVELGLKVAIVEDQFKFILNHEVVEKQTDAQMVQAFIKKTSFPDLISCSLDKGFHSPDNQQELPKILDTIALPKKGKLSKKDIEHQTSEAFKSAKNKHSAVESAINALEVHGLDRCPDRGIFGFKRYVSLAVLARNIQVIGAVLTKRELKKAAI